jgi:hypothetical protein
MAKNIVNRKGEKLAKRILDIMGIDLLTDDSVKIIGVINVSYFPWHAGAVSV